MASEVSARSSALFALTVLGAVVVGLALRLPALETGMVSDDFVESAMLGGVYPSPRSSLDLFDFTDGTAEDRRVLMDYGALPWWTVPGLRLAMMRPLASALVVFDHEVLGPDPFRWHLHSAFWWVVTIVVVALLLRRLLRPAVAALAVFVFALEEGHTLPLGWLANRGALVAMALGFAGLLAHLRYRVDGSRAGRAWSWGLFTLAVTCGEWAFPVLGYVMAFELLGASEPLRVRLRAALPAIVPGVAFVCARALLGYGALRSGVYIDPFTEPLDFAQACVLRIPVFFADLLFSIPSMWWDFGSPWREVILTRGVIPPELWLRLPGWRTYHFLIGLCAIALSMVVVRRGLRGASAAERLQLKWLLFGAFLSLIPMVASFPTSRLVLPASVAASALVAAVILQGARYVAERGGGVLRRMAGLAVVLALAYAQLFQAARTSASDTFWSQRLHAATRRWIREADLDVEGIETKDVIVLSSSEHTIAVFAPFARWQAGFPMPRSYRTLSAAPQAFDLHRTKDNVLELSVLAGTLLDNDMEKLYRSDKYPLRVGDRIELEGLRVDVLRLQRGKPQRVRFTFARSLDDPRYVVLNSTLFGLRRVTLPEVGQVERYPRPVFPDEDALDFALSFADTNSSCVVRPPIDECRYGHAFADCGGTGEPVFACHGYSDCRWFVGGCVAQGYVSSACGRSNVCCLAGWPFDVADEAFTTGGLRRAVANALAGWGGEPFGVDRAMNLDVEEDPTLGWGGVRLACHGDMGDGGPCDVATVKALPEHFASFALAFEPSRPVGGWGLTLEVVRDRDGTLRGRACKLVIAQNEVGDCPGPGEPQCAIRGEIVVDALPELPGESGSVRGRFLADFGGGRMVDGAF